MKKMNKKLNKYVVVACTALAVTGCKLPNVVQRTENKTVPEAYGSSTAGQDTINTGKMKWKQFFTDPHLTALIDTALANNQELNITLQEIQIAQSEVRARKGEYLPFVGLGAGADITKASRNTTQGALEHNINIISGKENPEPLPNYTFGANVSWEVDIWKKLRNAKKASVNRYLASVEGKNFVVTNLIAEIANSYYELLALDNQLEIVKQNIEIQGNALQIVKMEKEATRVTELAVRRFQAQVFHTVELQFSIQQKITETENRINLLAGRFPQHIARSSESFSNLVPNKINSGIPSQILENRPDVKQAEQELAAAKLDIKVAKARFYPSLNISAGLGYQAFNPQYIVTSPESLIYSLAGELAAPLINRNAIKAAYISANAKQIQAVYKYERTIINAYIEVANQLAKINNIQNSYNLKIQEVEALTESVAISNKLFTSARADYMEVLLTQRDALESRFDLIETKMQQMNAMVNVYRALGGGCN